MSEKPRVVRSTKTCPACPAQWDLTVGDGRHVYVRFRWGGLSASIGPTYDEAVSGEELFYGEVGHGLEGDMDEETMRRHLSAVLEFGEIGKG